MLATEISKATFKHIESEWYKYEQTVREIKRLRYSVIESTTRDENVGGGRSNMVSKPTEILATRLTTHKQLEYLEDIVYAIETVYNLVPDHHKKLIKLRYWSNENYDWDHIATQLNVSKRQALRWRDRIISDTAEMLGWR